MPDNYIWLKATERDRWEWRHICICQSCAICNFQSSPSPDMVQRKTLPPTWSWSPDFLHLKVILMLLYHFPASVACSAWPAAHDRPSPSLFVIYIKLAAKTNAEHSNKINMYKRKDLPEDKRLLTTVNDLSENGWAACSSSDFVI